MTASGLMQRQQNRAGWIPALLLFALLIRGLVPVGWMPALGLQGPQLVICTTSGFAAAPVDLRTPANEQAPPTADHSPCAFAGIGAPLLPATFALPFSYAMLAIASTLPTGPPALFADSRAHIRPPAQAPPTLR